MKTKEWVEKHKTLLIILHEYIGKGDFISKKIRNTRKRLVTLDKELIKGMVEK